MPYTKGLIGSTNLTVFFSKSKVFLLFIFFLKENKTIYQKSQTTIKSAMAATSMAFFTTITSTFFYLLLKYLKSHFTNVRHVYQK